MTIGEAVKALQARGEPPTCEAVGRELYAHGSLTPAVAQALNRLSGYCTADMERQIAKWGRG